jgi:hypothetical protein
MPGVTCFTGTTPGVHGVFVVVVRVQPTERRETFVVYAKRRDAVFVGDRLSMVALSGLNGLRTPCTAMTFPPEDRREVTGE